MDSWFLELNGNSRFFLFRWLELLDVYMDFFCGDCSEVFESVVDDFFFFFLVGRFFGWDDEWNFCFFVV